jgi:Asp-tRNA(Asn)/Glu-tRNA(Gln) amidotransferase A subunit family amidase
MHGYIDHVQLLTAEHYAAALDQREALRSMHRQCYGRVDGFVTLAHIGPGQVGQQQGGTPFYNDASSAIGAPSMNLPVLSAQNVPLGVQLMGFEGQDRDMMGIGRWLIERTNRNLTGLPE